MDDLASAILGSAQHLGVDPVDLGTAISYETAGSFDPWKAGPTTQWGQHRGLIQWGEPQAKQYGVRHDMPVSEQMAAVERYLQDKGVKPGMGLMDIYSAINAGHVGLYGRSDAHNGGAPGTVADKVSYQMGPHRQNALALLQGAVAQDIAPPAPAAPQAPVARPVTVAQFVAPSAPQMPAGVAQAMMAGPPGPQPETQPAPQLGGLGKLADMFVNVSQAMAHPAAAPVDTFAVEAERQARRRALLGAGPDPYTRAILA